MANWPWSRLGQRALAPSLQVLLCAASPTERDAGWVEWVNGSPPPQENDAIRHCLHQGRPFGSDAWLSRTMRQLGWREPGKPGRPRAPCATSVTMRVWCGSVMGGSLFSFPLLHHKCR